VGPKIDHMRGSRSACLNLCFMSGQIKRKSSTGSTCGESHFYGSGLNRRADISADTARGRDGNVLRAGCVGLCNTSMCSHNKSDRCCVHAFQPETAYQIHDLQPISRLQIDRSIFLSACLGRRILHLSRHTYTSCHIRRYTASWP